MKQYIKQNEGSKKDEKGRHILYVCSSGKITCGWGRNLTDNGISEYEATILLDADIVDALVDLRKVFNHDDFETLSFDRKMAQTDMMFNMGLNKFLGFKKMIQAIKDKNFDKAGDEIVDSEYWRGKTHNRAAKNEELMRKG